MNKPREITIRPVLNGYHCQVGCQQLVFETREKLVKELDRYLTKPSDVEDEYRKTHGLNDMEPACDAQVACDRERPRSDLNTEYVPTRSVLR